MDALEGVHLWTAVHSVQLGSRMDHGAGKAELEAVISVLASWAWEHCVRVDGQDWTGPKPAPVVQVLAI